MSSFPENSGSVYMSNASKNTIFGSIAVAAIVAILAILDLITKSPFSGQTMMDIMFLIGAALVIYMGYDAYQDLK